MGILPQLYSVFASKAPATVVGWIWKAALVLTLQAVLHRGSGPFRAGIREARSSEDMGDGDKHALGGILVMVLGRYMVFLLLLLVTVVISRRVEESQMTATRRTTLLAGLALIPAWAFKDVVVSFIGAFSGDFVGHQLVMGSFVVCVATALSSVLPTKDESRSSPQGRFSFSVLATAGACMGLGVAYAINLVFKDRAGDLWSKVMFQLIYAPSLTCLMLTLRPYISSQIQAESGLRKRMLTFLFSTTGFLAAWTWAALLADVIAHLWPAPPDDKHAAIVFRQFVWTVAVTLIIAIVVPCTVPSDEERQRRCASRTELITLCGGVVVGGTWTDLVSTIYDLWNSSTSNASGLAVVKCWALVAVLTVLMPLLTQLLASVLLPEYPQGSRAGSQVELRGPPDGDGGDSGDA